jgi:hypothetical protein
MFIMNKTMFSTEYPDGCQNVLSSIEPSTRPVQPEVFRKHHALNETNEGCRAGACEEDFEGSMQIVMRLLSYPHPRFLSTPTYI